MSFWSRRRDARRKQRLLIEISAFIFVVLATCLWSPRLGDFHFRSPQLIAKTQIMELKGALELFYADVGRYPTTDEGLTALIRDPATAKGWKGPYIVIKRIPDDPWGHSYIYRCPGRDRPFDLLCYGRDGKESGTGLDTDITY